MKSILLIIIIFLSLNSYSQNLDTLKNRKLAQLEEYIYMNGVLSETVYKDIGKIGRSEIKAVVYKDLTNERMEKGLQIDRFVSIYERRVNYIDYKEVIDLKNAINYIFEKVNNFMPTIFTNYKFLSKSSFEFGAYWTDSSKKWQYYIIIDRVINNEKIDLKDSDAITFLNTINSSIDYLEKQSHF